MLLFLVYHRVSTGPPTGRYTVGVDALLSDLTAVRQSMVPVIDPGRMAAPHGPNGVVLAFDDGTVDHFQVVLPVLSDCGLPGLFYVPTGRLGEPGHLSHRMVHEVLRSGHTVGSHGHSHRRLDLMSCDAIRAELGQSRKILRDILGEFPRHFAPPGGFFNIPVQVAAQQAGFVFLRTMQWGFNRRFDPMRIEAVPMTNALTRTMLPSVLRRRGEWLLKVAYRSKEGLRIVTATRRRGMKGAHV